MLAARCGFKLAAIRAADAAILCAAAPKSASAKSRPPDDGKCVSGHDTPAQEKSRLRFSPESASEGEEGPANPSGQGGPVRKEACWKSLNTSGARIPGNFSARAARGFAAAK